MFVFKQFSKYLFPSQLNLFVFLLALQASVQIKAAVSDYGNLRVLLWLSIVLLPLLAALWILALLAVNDALDELHYAYSVTSLLCALYVFIGHCLVNRRVRYNIRITWLRLTRSGSRGSEESFTATRTSGVQNTPAHMIGSAGAHGFMQPMDQLMGLEGEPSSSTTSRSNRGGSGTGQAEDSVDGLYYEGGGKRHRRHRSKCRRRRHRHRSKQAAAFGSETGSSDDVSYDQSMELASSHSSDEDEDGPGRIINLQERLRPSGPLLEQQMQQRGQQELLEQQQQNQINTLIRQSQHQSPSIYSTAQQQPQLKHSSSEQTNSSEAATIVYGQRLATTTTEGSTTLQRSNILAMTAGLSEQCHAPSASPAHSVHSIPSVPAAYGHYQHPISRPVPAVAPGQQLVEHIYSYARRPGQHYSTLGPRPAPDDSIGLPAVYNPESPYAIAAPRPMPRSVLQASVAAAGATGGSTSPSGSGSSQSSHVRLISQSVETSTNSAGVTSANLDR